MGIFGMFGSQKKDLRIADAEEQAYKEEKTKKEQEKMKRLIAKAKARGKARATPLSEKILSAGKSAGKTLTSSKFQKRIAKMGSSMAGGYTPKGRSGKRKRKSKDPFDFGW